ncbi:MAG: hypothetical protein JO332_11865 [Planctomycetaceae bacterium]|nr:hypothetical protein [Planctomycetaceae bacterium]
MLEGLVWMVLGNAGLLLAAHAACRRLRTGRPALDGLLFVLVHLVLISVAVLAAGVGGFLTPRGLGIPATGLLALLVLAGEQKTLPRPTRPDAGLAVLILSGLLAARLVLQVWFLSPMSGDACAYHLTKVAEWVRAGAFTREMGLDSHATFPAGFELIDTWWVVFLHHDVLIEAAGAEFALLGFLAVRALALGLGSSSRAAWTAATLYVLTPAFSVQAVSCLNDAPVAAGILSIAALVAERAHPALVLIPLGLVLGIKGTGVYALPGWLLLAFFERKQPRLSPSSVRAALAVAGAAVVAGAFWYVRNLIWFGSPTYPLGSKAPEHEELERLIQIGPSLASLGKNLNELVGAMITDDRSGFSGTLPGVAGWGIVAFSVGALAAVLECRRDPAFRKAAAAFVVSMLSVFLMVKNDSWFARFVLFAPAILCIAAARLAEASRPAAALVALGAVLEFAATVVPQGPAGVGPWALARMPWRERSAAALLGVEPPASPVGVYANRRLPTYLMYGPDFSRRVVYLRSPQPADLPAELRGQGVTLLYMGLQGRSVFVFNDLVRVGVFRPLTGRFYELPEGIPSHR